MANRVVIKAVAFLTISGALLVSVFSTGDRQAVNKAAMMLDPDSISNVRESIHASKKAMMLDTLISARVKRTGFNGCILVAQQGQILYEHAFGYADFKTRDSLHLNSSFQLASASKTLTAGAVLLLADRGLLNLDDKIEKFFPGFPYRGISIKMLLAHRSGLFNYVYSCEGFCEKPNTYNGGVFDNQAMLDIIMQQKPAAYSPPDKKFEYCNTNYALLALIIEKVSGKKFADFMHDEIFMPLGMNSTWVHDPQKDQFRKNRTIGHLANGKHEEECYADDVVGDKGIYSTVEDMLKWDQSLYTASLLKQETIEMAFKGYSNEHKGKRNYGLGWRLIDDGKNPKIIYHNGWWHGYNSLFFRRPTDRTTVVILSNKYNRGTYNIQDILGLLAGGQGSADMEGEE